MPAALTSGPPEVPGLIDASVWVASLIVTLGLIATAAVAVQLAVRALTMPR